MKTTREVVDLYCITYISVECIVFAFSVYHICSGGLHLPISELCASLEAFVKMRLLCSSYGYGCIFLLCRFLRMCVYCIQFMDIRHSQSTCHTCCSTSCRPGSGLSIDNNVQEKNSSLDHYLSCFVKNKRVLARQLVGHS